MDTHSSDSKEKPHIKCAIYTRVSTSEGLEQEFSSLDNQRESSESYIQSQKSQGWILLPECYDDGGYTGANTDRPALQKLLSDIKINKINCVVVYKVDRLSRSLLDFSQLLEFFDQNKVTFVSVTQHFNTNSSMGRLTLNILLSFAQFEREIISERTRDKMGAAKKKGKWIGGCLPLGYDLNKENHRLVINPAEAAIVKELFDLYLKERSLLSVTKIANEKGYRTKIRNMADGKVGGGVKFTTTSIAKILNNAHYIGKVRYQNALYPGEQERILNDQIFTQVQEALRYHPNKPQIRTPTGKKIGLLSRLLKCSACNKSMYFSYSSKRGKIRYCHYVCSNAQKRGYDECPTKLVNVGLMETKVLECLRKITKDQRLTPKEWDTCNLEEKRTILQNVVQEIGYNGKDGILEILLNEKKKIFKFEVSKDELKHHPVPPRHQPMETVPQLRQNLLLAHQIDDLIAEGKAEGLKQIAGWLNMNHQRLNQIMNLLLLAPKIQEEIICPKNEVISSIPEYKLRDIAFELCWHKQLEMWQSLTKD
ncbi:MAG: recombinase family protein [Phycisphaerae bacterium]|nr:recombinase family protein [Phycisphaerae bacterium]